MQTKVKNRDLMGSADLKKLLPKMAIPTIMAQLITTVYNLVDTYFVSTLGTNATAAVGVNSSLERAISLLGTLIGAGACSYIARLLGAKRDEEANQVMSSSFSAGFFLGLLLTIVGTIGITPLVNFLGATDDCRQYSIQYATYVLIAAPFMTGSLILNMCLRSEGSATYALIGMGFGGILNCFLDPLFIYTFDLGVAGASMATAISKFISFCILFFPYLRKQTVTSIAFRYIKFKMEHVKEVISIGMASFLRSMFGVVAGIVLNRVAGSYSTSVLAAVSVANRIMQFPFALILGFGQGIQPVIGFNWGAGNKKRVRYTLKFSLMVALIGGVSIGAILFIIAKPVIRIFNSAADAEIMKYGALAIRLECFALLIHASGTCINVFYAGIGKAKQSLLTSTARQGYCFLPVVWLLPKLLGVYGICASQLVADIVSLAVFIPMTIKAFRLLDAPENASV